MTVTNARPNGSARLQDRFQPTEKDRRSSLPYICKQVDIYAVLGMQEAV